MTAKITNKDNVMEGKTRPSFVTRLSAEALFAKDESDRVSSPKHMVKI